MKKEQSTRHERMKNLLIALGALATAVYACSETNRRYQEEQQMLDELCGKDRSACIEYTTVECGGLFGNGVPSCFDYTKYATPTPSSEERE